MREERVAVGGARGQPAVHVERGVWRRFGDGITVGRAGRRSRAGGTSDGDPVYVGRGGRMPDERDRADRRPGSDEPGDGCECGALIGEPVRRGCNGRATGRRDAHVDDTGCAGGRRDQNLPGTHVVERGSLVGPEEDVRRRSEVSADDRDAGAACGRPARRADGGHRRHRGVVAVVISESGRRGAMVGVHEDVDRADAVRGCRDQQTRRADNVNADPDARPERHTGDIREPAAIDGDPGAAGGRPRGGADARDGHSRCRSCRNRHSDACDDGQSSDCCRDDATRSPGHDASPSDRLPCGVDLDPG